MSWQDDEIAGPMGYEHCVLFDCARDALDAYHTWSPAPLGLPENICPELVTYMRDREHEVVLGLVDQLTGLPVRGAVHLYGYQTSHIGDAQLSLDPLMTGWVRHLTTPHAIISFGLKKTLSIGYGGAFLTDDKSLAAEMENSGHWNPDYNDLLHASLPKIKVWRLQRFDVIALWDRFLGDSLIRIPAEQLMPWRAMRRARDKGERDVIKEEVRDAGYPVGTNYPPLTGRNQWGDTVLNFSVDLERREIFEISEIVKRVVGDG